MGGKRASGGRDYCRRASSVSGAGEESPSFMQCRWVTGEARLGESGSGGNRHQIWRVPEQELGRDESAVRHEGTATASGQGPGGLQDETRHQQ